MVKCVKCGQPIGWVDCPTGGWWAHEVHPSDDHDARSEADVIAEILFYVYKRSKQGDPEADELLAKYSHYAF